MKIKIFSEASRTFFIQLVNGVMKERDEKHIIRPDMIHLLMEAKKGISTHSIRIIIWERYSSSFLYNKRDKDFKVIEIINSIDRDIDRSHDKSLVDIWYTDVLF